MRLGNLVIGGLVVGMLLPGAVSAQGWPMRSMDLQNTGNAGFQHGWFPDLMNQLGILREYSTEGDVHTTPAVTSDGLLVTGDSAGNLYVFDTADGSERARVSLGAPVAAAPFLGEVAGRERAYVAVASAEETLWCVDLDSVRAGAGDVSCPGFPISLDGGSGANTYAGTPILSHSQEIVLPGGGAAPQDVIFAPTTGDACSEAGMRAIDAETGEVYWEFDQGGRIASAPAMNADRTIVYVMTGSCSSTNLPFDGSLVALDAASGSVVWYHERRIVDPLSIETTTGVLVADVDEFGGCNVVVSSDADGCFYGFPQEAVTGDDPLREGQQQLLWRRCVVPGGPDAGFSRSNMALASRYVVQQTTGALVPHVGVDDANAFAIDVCAGQVEWASSDVGNGRADAAVANEILFQVVASRTDDESFTPELQVTEILTDPPFAMSPRVLATVPLPHAPGQGAGGPAIAGGRLYVPTVEGVVELGVTNPSTSPPQARGRNLFLGPYPLPVAPAVGGGPEFDPETTLPFPADKTVEELSSYRS